MWEGLSSLRACRFKWCQGVGGQVNAAISFFPGSLLGAGSRCSAKHGYKMGCTKKEHSKHKLHSSAPHECLFWLLLSPQSPCPEHSPCLKIKSVKVMYACSDSVPSTFCLVLPTVEGTSTGLTILLTLAWKMPSHPV